MGLGTIEFSFSTTTSVMDKNTLGLAAECTKPTAPSLVFRSAQTVDENLVETGFTVMTALKQRSFRSAGK